MKTWFLISKLLHRELRAGLGGFWLFIACLAVGVATISGVGSIGASFTAGLQANARNLLGGDIDLRLVQRDFSKKHLDWLSSHSKVFSQTIEMRAMARPLDKPDRRTLIEFKAVDHAYPLVGNFQSSSTQPLSLLLKKTDEVWGAVADANLLRRLDLRLNDIVKVGATQFAIRATVVSEPDRAASFANFGPRLLVARDALIATQLIKPGSQIRYHSRVVLETDANQTDWRRQLAATFPHAGWRIRGLTDAAPGAQRFIDRMALFLSFISLTVLLVSGLGIANTIKSYLDTKTTTIATLRCVGASGGLIFHLYMSQVLVIAALGIIIGLGIGGGGAFAFTVLAQNRMPVVPIPGFYGEPIIIAATFGLLVSMTFSLWPIARAREVPAAALFRDAVAPNTTQPQQTYKMATILGMLLLAAFTILTAQDSSLAAWFVFGAITTMLLLWITAGFVKILARLAPHTGRSTLRVAIANLYRPGASTTNIILSLGCGLAILVAVGLIQGNLNHQITERLPERAPAFFFIDIQPDQVNNFDKAIKSVTGIGNYQRFPTLRGRIVRIDGVPVAQREVAESVKWAIRGDRVLTYLAKKPESAQIISGTWWDATYKGPPAISLDASIARGFGLTIGDTLTLNILGREITAVIMSLREIDWRSLQFDFAIIFAPGFLEHAPHSHIAAVEVLPESEDTVEEAATGSFPNVSSIRVREALAAAANQLAGIGVAISGLAVITILSGALVLLAAITANRRRQQYEAVIFKVLGATRLRLLGVFMLEYGILGAVTGLIGAFLGSFTAWAVITQLMKMKWIFMPQTIGIIITTCILLTLLLGFIGTWRVLGEKTSPYLRNR